MATIDRVTTSVRTRIDFGSLIGVWWASDSWAMPEAQQVAREIEALGFGSLFLPEAFGKECLTQTAQLDAGADHVVIQVLGERPGVDPRPALRELAAELGLGQRPGSTRRP